MKIYVKASSVDKLSNIQPIENESSEYWRLNDEIMQDYKSIFPKYDKFFCRGKWQNTDKGIQFIVTTFLTPDCPEYNDIQSQLQSIPLEYVYRAVSIPEYENILKTGKIKSNQSMNIGYEVERGYTCYSKSFPGFYLPEDGGYILKIKATPDMFMDDVDEYIKTASPVSINNIVEVNGIRV
jgi:hypothetical protein